MSRKLIHASGLAHLRTGLTIASHTGPYIPAIEQINMLQSVGVDPSAFIWVHAQSETDKTRYMEIARLGAWVSLDGLSDDNVDEYVKWITMMKTEALLHRTLVSHDAGWYDPEKPDGGTIRGYTTLFDKLIPALTSAGFSVLEIAQLVKVNPQTAFEIRVRRTAR